MSAPKRRLILQPDARADLNGIRLYTQKRWGIEQRRRYGAHLRQVMRSLLDHPERGRPRDEYYAGCRSILVEHHVVFYYLTEDAVVVDRVLHSSQDAADKLAP